VAEFTAHQVIQQAMIRVMLGEYGDEGTRPMVALCNADKYVCRMAREDYAKEQRAQTGQ